jgi:predicted enzyme related to lactoylglutathione lyase
MKAYSMRNNLIARIKCVSIPVRDQERSLKYYTEALGFEILTDQDLGKGRRWIELKIPGVDPNVVMFTAPGQESWIGHFSNVVFWTNTLEKNYEEMKSLEVEFVQPPTKEPWGSSALFKDVDGNTFCLSSK